MKQPDVSNPQSLFGADARYRAPVFQRFYVWKEKQLEDLQEDIDTAAPDGGEQFLGAIVLKDLGKPQGPTSPTEYLMIDGQQRLTTLYMILVALAHIAATHGDTQSSQYISRKLLAETDSEKYSGWPKLIPTLQDRKSLWSVLENHIDGVEEWDFKADPAESQPRRPDHLLAQWERILAHYKDVLIGDGGAFLKEEFNRILSNVQQNLKFICITLDAADDANAIFSKLNAKGVPLQLADLVRNEVFSKFPHEDPGKAERFYEKNWRRFEGTFPPKSLDQFFPIYSYIKFGGGVTKAEAFPRLQREWASTKPKSILADLQNYSRYYSSLVLYAPIEGLHADLNAHTEKLSRMPPTTVTWPFLIEVLRAAGDDRLSKTLAVKCLSMIESFLVRRSLVGLEPTGLHTVFKSLWGKTKGDPKSVLARIVTRTIQCPDDDELLETLTQEPSDTRKVRYYVLEEYERSFIKANKYDPLVDRAATLEHILPQNLTDSWAKIFSVEEHSRCIGLLGNLVPLSEKQNKSVKDHPWGKKRKRYRGSNWKTTQKVAGGKTWTPKRIDTRTVQLAKWVARRWPEITSFG